MDSEELVNILERLERYDPPHRISEKRTRLMSLRERLLALHARGHSWRSIARELSGSGEQFSADLLRAVCLTKRGRRAAKAPREKSDARQGSSAEHQTKVRPRMEPTRTIAARFGARGLKP